MTRERDRKRVLRELALERIRRRRRRVGASTGKNGGPGGRVARKSCATAPIRKLFVNDIEGHPSLVPRGLTHLKRPFDDLDGFCKSIRDHQATGWATCTVASFFMSLPLLAYTPIEDALAGHRGSSQSGKTHSVPRHATSLHHGARADSSNGTYRSELLRSRSEWRQTQRGRTGPSPIRTAAQ